MLEKRKIIVHTIKKNPLEQPSSNFHQLEPSLDNNDTPSTPSTLMQMADPYVRISKPSSFAASRYVFVCTRHTRIHTHTHVSSCKTSETRLSFFLLQFRHVDLHGHANSIRHETPRGNGLGASGSRHKVTTDRFLVDYFKSKLRRSVIPRARRSALLFRRLTFFSRNTEFPVLLLHGYIRSIEALATSTARYFGQKLGTVLSSRVSGNGNDRRQFERVIVNARREFEAVA